MNRFKAGIATVLLLLVVSCDHSRVYQEVYDFEEKTWNLDTIPAFKFKVADRKPKNLILDLRNSIAYKYQNLYLTYFLQDSLGRELASELINIPLFDMKTGKPLGKGNSIYQHTADILTGYSFPVSGYYTFRVAQYMRETDLEEIISVGLRVEEQLPD